MVTVKIPAYLGVKCDFYGVSRFWAYYVFGLSDLVFLLARARDPATCTVGSESIT